MKKRMKIIRTIGEPPVSSAMRQPHSGLNEVVAQTPTIEAPALAITALPWMNALPSPRRSLFQASLNSTMPAPHSPPRPTPVMKRSTARLA